MKKDELEMQSQILQQLKQRIRDSLKGVVECDVYKCNYCGKVRVYPKGETPTSLSCYCNGGFDPRTFGPKELIKYGDINGTMEKVAAVTSGMGFYLGEILEGYLQLVVINEDGSLEVKLKEK